LNLNKELFPVDDHLITDQDLDTLIQVLGTQEGFPFNSEELKFYLARTIGFSLNEEDNKEALLKDLYELLSTFYQQIKISVE
jgi:hypothetical protein